ncbi:L,D-transpeptidase family protein [Ancylobacter sp. MQZ15Z-1]|uniref:L,D-transpeptidase family protein n=1 Tax=Ancylobacter mangrovi TaxID=2972472 RepID=A0A9X2T7I5_9HYPH|nr:L,D-transpeptidase family protein [Ancylobacter mangrovi]MCS0497529.1 L,D-transpeptidase family protein [Ancylobacter mangrovi]
MRRNGRYLTGGACALAVSVAAGLAVALAHPLPAWAQEFSGAPIAVDPAGNGTGDAVAAFDPAASGMQDTGQGASLLASPGDEPAPFDMNEHRRPAVRQRTAALSAPPEMVPPAEPAAAVSNTPAAPASEGMTPATPSVGNGAPGTGAATPGSTTPDVATPAAPTPGAVTPGATPAAPTPATAEQPQAPGQMVPTYLSDLLSSQAGHYVARENERQALVDFYTARDYRPAFTAGSGLSPLGKAAVAAFAGSFADGLNPADYVAPALTPDAPDAAVAEAELRLAGAALLYARHVQSGRFDPKRISDNIGPSPTVPDPAAVLAQLAGSPDPRATFASFAPQYDEYRLLKRQLARLEKSGPALPPPTVPSGPLLRPGDSDPRVPVLRERLGIGGAPEDTTYDDLLVEAVRDFQSMAGQKVDGIVGRDTLSALNENSAPQVADVIANMERWRWLPHDVAPAYVMVNIPEFMVRVVVNEQTVHETRVVVGKPQNQTPLLTQDMEYVVFNPSWHVPPGIIRKEMLPALRANPYALERQGIDVVRNGRIIDPGTVDWSRGTQGYSFRQPPGERNALGRMKFMFPNKYAVYLHDTPSRSLFSRDYRAYSHGCVRVYEPLKFAEVIFGLGLPNDGWGEQRISRLIGGNEKYLNLKQHIQVNLVYFTNFVDASGRLVARDDLYGINQATKTILGLDGTSRVADRRGVISAR